MLLELLGQIPSQSFLKFIFMSMEHALGACKGISSGPHVEYSLQINEKMLLEHPGSDPLSSSLVYPHSKSMENVAEGTWANHFIFLS